MRSKQAIKSDILEFVDTMDESVLVNEAEKDRLKGLCDELLPHTAEPDPIDNPAAAEGVWLTRFASFGAKHSDNQPIRHTSNLLLQSFGNLPKVDVNVVKLHQEIERTTQAYNNVVYVRNPADTATGIVLMKGQYSRDEDNNTQRYAVAFTGVGFYPGDGQSEAQLREEFGIDTDAELEKSFRPPKLHSDIVFVDEDMRINYGALGGFYVLQRLQQPAYSVALN